MVVDGAVVMMENIMRHLSHHGKNISPEAGRITMSMKTPVEMIRDAAHEVQRPVFFAIGIIITAYMPIFTLQRVEGRLFRPMPGPLPSRYSAPSYSPFSLCRCLLPCSSRVVSRNGATRSWNS